MALPLTAPQAKCPSGLSSSRGGKGCLKWLHVVLLFGLRRGSSRRSLQVRVVERIVQQQPDCMRADVSPLGVTKDDDVPWSGKVGR